MEPQNQDVDLILVTQYVTIQSPHPLIEQAPSKGEAIFPLDDSLLMDTYNLTYDDPQKNIIQARKKHFSDDLTSPTLIGEGVIMTNTRKNLNATATSNLASQVQQSQTQSI